MTFSLNRRTLAVSVLPKFFQTVLISILLFTTGTLAKSLVKTPRYSLINTNQVTFNQKYHVDNASNYKSFLTTTYLTTMATSTDATSPVSSPSPRDEDAEFHDTIDRRLTSLSNSANSVASDLLPTDLNDPTTASKTITIGGIDFELEPTEQVITTSIALYTKAMRATYDADKKGQLDLLKLVQGKQQQLYSAISISVNDPEKLLNHYSLSKLNKECRRNLAKYDLLSPFTIVFPTSLGSSSLLLKEGVLVSHDLFSNTLKVTAQQVADSTRWYRGFPSPKSRLHEDLSWSLAYFENNVDSALYARIHSKILTYDERCRGGPLFFKLLNDETTTTSDSNKKALITIVDTYKIRVSCKGERIPDVIDLFRAITDTVYALHDDSLPDEYVDKLIEIFTTTSVQVFNDLFEELKRQLFSSSLQIDLDELIVPISRTSSLGNDLKGANYVLNYAGRAFYTLSQRGDWDKCLQQPAGDPAAHMAQSGGEATSSGIRCFNCDDNHHIKHCPLPRDHAKITKARNERGGGDQPSKFGRRPFTRPTKWRLPEEGENNKRVIDGKPYTFNPTSKRWDADTVPDSGIPPTAAVVPPATPTGQQSTPAPATPTTLTLPAMPTLPLAQGAFFTGYGGSPIMDRESHKRALAQQMVQLKQAYENM